MTDDLASNLNYTGRGSKTKQKFSDTVLDRIICGTLTVFFVTDYLYKVYENNLSNCCIYITEVVSKDEKLNAKRKDVADCIGKWLLHAPDRIKYKKKSLPNFTD